LLADSAKAVRAAGLVPSGFSLEESFVTLRPSSVVERPGTYGAIASIQG
jgi:hypothetical protein